MKIRLSLSPVLMISVFQACTSEMSPEHARSELGRLNVPYSERSLIDCARNGDKVAVELLLRAGINPNARDVDGHLAYEFARQEESDSFRFRIEWQEALNQVAAGQFGPNRRESTTALMAAAVGGHADVVKLLLERGAEVDLRDRSQMSALTYACWKGHSRAVKLLIDGGANPSFYSEKLNARPVDASRDDETTAIIQAASQ